MNTHATFKQKDVERAIKAVRDAGLPVGSVEITKDGTIRVLTKENEKVVPEQDFDL